jgi:hypothetical protein
VPNTITEWKRATEGVDGFWLKGKEKWGGGVQCGWRHVEKGEGGPGAVTPRRGGRRGGGGLAADGMRTGGTRGQPAATGAGRCHGALEQGSGAVHVGHAEGRGPIGERRELGRPESNSDDFDLKRISKLNSI